MHLFNKLTNVRRTTEHFIQQEAIAAILEQNSVKE